METTLLVLIGVFALIAVNFAKDFAHDIRNTVPDDASLARFSSLLALVVLCAAGIGILVCGVGYTIHLRLDEIELHATKPQ